MRFLSASPWPRSSSDLAVGLGADHDRLALGLCPDGLRAAADRSPADPPPPAHARCACADKQPGCWQQAGPRGSGERPPSRCRGSAACWFTSSWMRFISLAALRPHDGVARSAREDVTHGGVREARQALVCQRDAADCLIELQRIDDAITREGVDFEVLAIGRKQRLNRQIEIEDRACRNKSRYRPGAI